MPRALRICAEPGCPHVAAVRGRCAWHARQPWAHAEASRHRRGYGSAHEARRLQVLLEERVCLYCRRELLELQGDLGWWPIKGVATIDHKKPKAQGGTDERTNLCACCRDCQQAKAGREGAAARHATAAV